MYVSHNYLTDMLQCYICSVYAIAFKRMLVQQCLEYFGCDSYLMTDSEITSIFCLF